MLARIETRFQLVVLIAQFAFLGRPNGLLIFQRGFKRQQLGMQLTLALHAGAALHWIFAEPLNCVTDVKETLKKTSKSGEIRQSQALNG
ncbi:hypothetical protein [Pseudomonas cerasi]|uniref:hypothetical protein n=1 Tax=Pseudomonas cerasi TaxID=1583341 RepID=UPI000CF1609E|nr:hypothetical protein [Pseudomonas cerasi]